MKRKIKIITLVYLGVAVLTYALTLRVDKLESMEESNTYQNKSIVLKLK